MPLNIPKPSAENKPEEQVPPFEVCPAKSCADGTRGTTVYDHCRYAGYVAEALLELLPEVIRALYPQSAPYLVSLHDIGKVSRDFLAKYFSNFLEERCKCRVEKGVQLKDHSSLGARTLQLNGTVSFIVEVVAAHHGYENDKLASCSSTKSWRDEQLRLVKTLAKEFNAEEVDLTCVECPSKQLLAGLTCVSDWIASDETFFPPNQQSLTPLEGRARAKYAVGTCGFHRPELREGLSFSDIFGFEPYSAQRKFIDMVQKPGVYVLEAPMGLGKTEAALYAAYRLICTQQANGIYFALPTRLTSDRIHARARHFLDKVSSSKTAVKLAHGHAWLKEDESGFAMWGEDVKVSSKPPPWFNPSKRGLLYPYAVGTVDQALMAVINVKHSFVRSLGLAGKVVILDEVHSYDMYTGTLLNQLVRNLKEIGATVIILSATLTGERRNEFLGNTQSESGNLAYPLASAKVYSESTVRTCELTAPSQKEVAVRWSDASGNAPLIEAIEKARAGCNVVCIANTVATSQLWFKTVKSEMREDDSFPVGLLHSRFTAKDREAIEDEWMSRLAKDGARRPRGSILIATQVVEQSVDIDADWMVSELAPVDMVFQRIGRLWRHPRSGRAIEHPEILLVCNHIPSALDDVTLDRKEYYFGKGAYVYAPYVLLRSYQELCKYKTLQLPSAIRPILEEVYATRGDIDLAQQQEMYHEMEEKCRKLSSFAVSAQASSLSTKQDDEDLALTRYSSRREVLLLMVKSIDDCGEGIGRLVLLDGTEVEVSSYTCDVKVARVLQRNTVLVGMNNKLRDRCRRPRFLRKYFADRSYFCLGCIDPDSGIIKDWEKDEEIGYAYRADFGAVRLKSEELSDENCSEDDNGEFVFSEKEDW